MQQLQQPGKILRWVKAIERLPDDGIKRPVRRLSNNDYTWIIVNGGYVNIDVDTQDMSFPAYKEFLKGWEWLEETEDLSAPASHVEEKRDSFVEWLTEEIAEAQKFHEYAEDEIQANYWKGARDAKIDVKMEYESLAKPSPVIEEKPDTKLVTSTDGERDRELVWTLVNWLTDEMVDWLPEMVVDAFMLSSDYSAIDSTDSDDILRNRYRTATQPPLPPVIEIGEQTPFWTDALAKEYAEVYRFSSSRITIEQFKASHPAPAPIVGSDKITKDYYINVRYEGDPVPDKAGRVEQNIAEGIFKAFSDWPNCKIEVEATSTINIPKPKNNQ